MKMLGDRVTQDPFVAMLMNELAKKKKRKLKNGTYEY